MDRNLQMDSSSRGKGVVPSLQSLCLEALAVAITVRDPGFHFDTLSALPAEFSERLQHILIGKNALDDTSLVMTTSARQTSLTIPFSITDEDASLSKDSVLHAITVRTLLQNLLYICLIHVRRWRYRANGWNQGGLFGRNSTAEGALTLFLHPSSGIPSPRLAFLPIHIDPHPPFHFPFHGFFLLRLRRLPLAIPINLRPSTSFS